MKPKRIQRKRTKGYRMPEGVVYVGRPTRWGNPFGKEYATVQTTEDIVAAYRALLTFDYKWFRSHAGFSWKAGFIISHVWRTRKDVARLLEPLRGKDLACWCALDKPCHADVLLELANR